MPLLHPFYDVSAGPEFPIGNMRDMPERFQFMSNPERPIAVACRIADKDIRHALVPQSCLAHDRSRIGCAQASLKAKRRIRTWCGNGRRWPSSELYSDAFDVCSRSKAGSDGLAARPSVSHAL